MAWIFLCLLRCIVSSGLWIKFIINCVTSFNCNTSFFFYKFLYTVLVCREVQLNGRAHTGITTSLLTRGTTLIAPSKDWGLVTLVGSLIIVLDLEVYRNMTHSFSISQHALRSIFLTPKLIFAVWRTAKECWWFKKAEVL